MLNTNIYLFKCIYLVMYDILKYIHQKYFEKTNNNKNINDNSITWTLKITN